MNTLGTKKNKTVEFGKKHTIEAPAKINLCLYVTEKRSDGYHNLVTIMQKLNLCDLLEIEINSKGSIDFFCDVKDIPAGKHNLAVQAAHLFLSQSQKLKGHGLTIHLQKNIPIAAGLGGGSSDAGAVLKHLNLCTGGEFSQMEMIAMGRQLGADVPFFVIDDSAVFAEGIGDIMQPVDSFGNFDFLLINPAFFVSTAQIFQNLLLTSHLQSSTIARLRRGNITLEDMQNDLEKVTFPIYPLLEEIKCALQDFGADKVIMSGSGATMLGFFKKSVDNKRKSCILDSLQDRYGKLVFWADVHWGVAKR